MCFAGTKSTVVTDFKGRNVPDDKEKEDEENDALDFFKEEKTPDLISKLATLENAEKNEKKEEEEEEEDLDPLGIIRYGCRDFCCLIFCLILLKISLFHVSVPSSQCYII